MTAPNNIMEREKMRKSIICPLVSMLLLLLTLFTGCGANNGNYQMCNAINEERTADIAEVKDVTANADAAADKDIAADTGQEEYGPLIQTTTFEEEYKSGVHIGKMAVIPLEEPDVEEAYGRVRRGIVKINAGGLYGSGVIWEMNENEILIISSRHLIEGWNAESTITYSSGMKTGGELMKLSAEYDLGVIRVSRDLFTYEELTRLGAITGGPEAYNGMRAGDTLFVAGSADGAGENMYEGTFESGWWYMEEFDCHMILGFCYAKAGMSGGGIFDAYGNFIGLMSGGTGGDEIAGLPVTIIMEECGGRNR